MLSLMAVTATLLTPTVGVSELDAAAIYSTERLVVASDILGSVQAAVELSIGAPRWTRKPAIFDGHLDFGAGRQRPRDLLTLLKHIDSAKDAADRDPDPESRLSTAIGNHEVLAAMRAGSDSDGDERSSPSVLPPLLEDANVGNQDGGKSYQSGDDGSVVHVLPERSRLFDGRTSRGEHLAIFLLFAALAGTSAGATIAWARLAEGRPVFRVLCIVAAAGSLAALLWAVAIS